SQGEKIPEKVFNHARRALEAARTKEGAFVYAGSVDDSKDGSNKSLGGVSLEGSVSRSVLCETTLALLGGSSIQAVRFALDNFFKHWDELEKCRKKNGHQEPYGIAPYFFFFGHRYAAQCIQLLPEKNRAAQRERLWKLLLQTREDDGTW